MVDHASVHRYSFTFRVPEPFAYTFGTNLFGFLSGNFNLGVSFFVLDFKSRTPGKSAALASCISGLAIDSHPFFRWKQYNTVYSLHIYVGCLLFTQSDPV